MQTGRPWGGPFFLLIVAALLARLGVGWLQKKGAGQLQAVNAMLLFGLSLPCQGVGLPSGRPGLAG